MKHIMVQIQSRTNLTKIENTEEHYTDGMMNTVKETGCCSTTGQHYGLRGVTLVEPFSKTYPGRGEWIPGVVDQKQSAENVGR